MKRKKVKLLAFILTVSMMLTLFTSAAMADGKSVEESAEPTVETDLTPDALILPAAEPAVEETSTQQSESETDLAEAQTPTQETAADETAETIAQEPSSEEGTASEQTGSEVSEESSEEETIESYTLDGNPATALSKTHSDVSASGSFAITEAARFFIVSASDPTGTQLGDYVQLLCREFAAKGIPGSAALPIVYGEESLAQAGDIIVKLDSSLSAATYRAEGYQRVTTNENITISARNAAGVFYGLRGLLQNAAASGTSVGCGTVKEAPDVTDRVLLLDCGRKYFTKDWIVSLIRDMSWLGYNQLMLGIGNDGLRFMLDDMSITADGNSYSSSAVKTAIDNGNAAYSSAGYLTQSEMDDIIATAAQYNIQIVPMLNSPGHMDAILDAMSALGISSPYFVGYSTSERSVSLTNTAALNFTKALVAKYCAYFSAKGCSYFHIGADEYGNDAYGGGMGFTNMGSTLYNKFIAFVNDLAAIVKDYGMTPRAWNDGLYYGSYTNAVDTDVQVTYWSSGWSGYSVESASSMANIGHYMINSNGDFYYVLGKTSATASSIYSNFSNTSFMGSSGVIGGGSQYCIWCDYPDAQTETQVASGSYQALRAFGVKMWGSERVAYASIGSAPRGFNTSGAIDTVSMPAASAITAAAPAAEPAYAIGDFSASASRTGETTVSVSWTTPELTVINADAAGDYVLTMSVAKNGRTVASYIDGTLSYADNDAASAATYTVTASVTVAGESAAEDVSKTAAVSAVRPENIPAYAAGSVNAAAGETTYALDTDGVDTGVYALVIYNTLNESAANYYAVSTDVVTANGATGLVTTRATSYVNSSAGSISLEGLTGRSYLWNVTKNGSAYTISAADGNGIMSIDGTSSVSLSGSNTSLRLAAGSRTNAWYVNYSGTGGLRIDMHSDRTGYTPANSQCLLSAWGTSSTANHNQLYFYKQNVVAAGYSTDCANLRELTDFAAALSAEEYPNWDSLGMPAKLAAANDALALSDSYDNAADAAGAQNSVNACAEALCSALNALSTVSVAHEHSYTAVVTAPTCTQDGYTTYTCSCGDSYVDDETAALGHDYSAVVTAPTCTQKGYTTYTCERCGDSYVDDETAALGHDYSAVVTAPTCTQKGYTTYTCETCGDEYTGNETAALGHDYDMTETAATCTEAGERVYTCSRCGESYTQTIAALGHSYTDVTVTKEATCTEDGEMTYTCTRCGGTYTEAIHAAGHDYNAVVTTPTCTQKGYTTYTCETCGDEYTGDETDALGHDYACALTSPTCTQDGSAVYTCRRCADSYTETIPATGHSYTDVVTAPTCTQGGFTTHTCVCGDSYVDSRTEALGHDYSAVVTAPTCTEGGYTTYTCTRCGDHYTADETDAVGHVYNEVQTPATCTQDGSIVKVCAGCGDTITEILPATGHSDANEDGLCDACGAQLSAVWVPVCSADVYKRVNTPDGSKPFIITNTSVTSTYAMSASGNSVTRSSVDTTTVTDGYDISDVTTSKEWYMDDAGYIYCMVNGSPRYLNCTGSRSFTLSLSSTASTVWNVKNSYIYTYKGARSVYLRYTSSTFKATTSYSSVYIYQQIQSAANGEAALTGVTSYTVSAADMLSEDSILAAAQVVYRDTEGVETTLSWFDDDVNVSWSPAYNAFSAGTYVMTVSYFGCVVGTVTVTVTDSMEAPTIGLSKSNVSLYSYYAWYYGGRDYDYVYVTNDMPEGWTFTGLSTETANASIATAEVRDTTVTVYSSTNTGSTVITVFANFEKGGETAHICQSINVTVY